MVEVDIRSSVERELVVWLESHIGKVTGLRRQNRRRPCWFADV
jgi:hypothetical protein